MQTRPTALEHARAALQSADWQTARAQFEAALATTESPEARDGLGLALWWLNDVVGSHEQRTLGYLGYKQRGQPRQAARLAGWLAREQVFLRSNASAMNGWFARADRLLADQGDCAERGWVDLYRATMDGAPGAVAAVARRVIGIAQRCNDASLEALALVNWGKAAVDVGEVRTGMTRIDEAMTAATSGEVGDLHAACETFCVTLSACELAGDLERVAHWCERASAYAQRHNSPFLSAYCRTTYGSLLAATGRWHEAEAALADAIDVFDRGHRGLRVHAVLKLAELRIGQGRLDEAELLLSGYEDMGGAVLPLARLHLAQQDAEGAQAVLAHALASGGRERSLGRAPLLTLAADIASQQRRFDTARAACEELRALAEAAGSEWLSAQSEIAFAQLERAQGEGTGIARLQRALAHLARYEQSQVAGRIKLEMARSLRDTDRPGATAWARAALACFERCGALRDADEAARVLRDLGHGTRPGSRRHAALTEREQRVLDLVAAGLSNREIGARLMISPKTVEHHVSRLLGKLGLRNRSEAAAFAARQR